MLATIKFLQISHMEMINEAQRTEPRLGRLLGHMRTYDNLEHWRRGNAEQISRAEDQMKYRKPTPNSTPVYQNSINHARPILKLRTLAEFQAAMRAQTQAETQAPVTTEEVRSESDFEGDVDSEEILGDDSDNDSTWSDDEETIINLIKRDVRSLPRHGLSDDETRDMITSKTSARPKDLR
jgi:hypothetical protein